MNDQCCRAQFEATVKVFALVSVQLDHKGIPWLETIAYHSADITLMMKQLFYSERWCWSIRCKWKLIRWEAAQRSDCVVIPACSGAPCFVDQDCGQLVVRPNVSFQRLDERAKWFLHSDRHWHMMEIWRRTNAELLDCVGLRLLWRGQNWTWQPKDLKHLQDCKVLYRFHHQQ